MTTFTIPATAVYRNSETGVGRLYTEGAQIELSDALAHDVPGAVDRVTELNQNAVAAAHDGLGGSTWPIVRATSDGQDYGVIPAGEEIVSVEAANSAYCVTLPDVRSIGLLQLAPSPTAYKLRSASPATVAINGGAGDDAKTDVPAHTVVYCESARGQWYCHGKDANGGAVVIAPAS